MFKCKTEPRKESYREELPGSIQILFSRDEDRGNPVDLSSKKADCRNAKNVTLRCEMRLQVDDLRHD